MSERAAMQATIHGRVQGVAFRAFIIRKAAGLGLTGYVKNLPGGQVAVHAEGERKQVERLLGDIRQGPPAARVDRVETRWLEYSGKHTGFQIVY